MDTATITPYTHINIWEIGEGKSEIDTNTSCFIKVTVVNFLMNMKTPDTVPAL